MPRPVRNCNPPRPLRQQLQQTRRNVYSAIILETFEPRQLLTVAPVTQVAQVQSVSSLESLSSPLRNAVTNITNGAPQVLLTPSVLADVRAKASANTAQWQAFRANLDANLEQFVSDGAYQASWASSIADYALGYQVLKDSDPATAERYADKAVALLYSLTHDIQKAGEGPREIVFRGDGARNQYVIPHADVLPDTIKFFVSTVDVIPMTRDTTYGLSDYGSSLYNEQILKVSDTPDGPADYVEGVDWRHTGDQEGRQIEWVAGGHRPADGATYYVTGSGGALNAHNVAFTRNGLTCTLDVTPAANQVVYVQYIYGTHAADYSTLAYQQTSGGAGGFNSIRIDDSYPSRYLGKYAAIGYDWLYDYAGFSPALRAQAADLMVRWSDYERDHGYYADSPGSNYGAGGYVSRMFTALALSGRDPDADRLTAEVVAYHADNVLPVLQNPTASLKGGFWAEGWSYGQLATVNLLEAGLAFEQAGLGSAAAERQWAGEVVRSLAELQPTAATMYDGGDWFAYPAPAPQKDLYYVLAAATAATDPTAAAYANYAIQTHAGNNTNDATDLLFRDPSAAATSWTSGPNVLPLQAKADGAGLVTARADWSYNSTFLSFQLGNPVNADHQSFTPGQLELQRGGDTLLVNAPVTRDLQTGALKSQYGNVVAIDDGGAGAQNYRWSMGYWAGNAPGLVMTNYEAAADGSYVYAGGDYHAAYSLNTNPGAGGPASELTRQVFYLRPDLTVVYDRATTTQASYAKQLQWHLGAAPTMLGDNAWSVAVGGSKLFGQTFSGTPLTTASAPADIYGSAVPRVTTNPASPTASVRYATVLQTAASGTAAMVASARVASGDGKVEGVRAGDTVVLFGKDGPVAGGTGYAVTAANGVVLTHYLTDMAPGATYALAGADQATATASPQGVLTFTTTGTGGTQTVTIS